MTFYSTFNDKFVDTTSVVDMYNYYYNHLPVLLTAIRSRERDGDRDVLASLRLVFYCNDRMRFNIITSIVQNKKSSWNTFYYIFLIIQTVSNKTSPAYLSPDDPSLHQISPLPLLLHHSVDDCRVRDGDGERPGEGGVASTFSDTFSLLGPGNDLMRKS